MVLTWKVFCIPASEPICIFNPLTANSCLWLCRADSRFPFCVGWPGRFLSPTDRHGEQGGGVPVLPEVRNVTELMGWSRGCVCAGPRAPRARMWKTMQLLTVLARISRQPTEHFAITFVA